MRRITGCAVATAVIAGLLGPAAPQSWADATQAVSASAATPLPWAFYLAPIGAVLALLFAWTFYGGMMKATEGDPEMVRIAQAVRDGAYAYLSRQRKIIVIVFIGLVAVLAFLGFVMGIQPKLSVVGVPIAGFLSGLCGFFGMKTATNGVSADDRRGQAVAQRRTEGRVSRRCGDGLVCHRVCPT